ncbi:hypothetical protein K144316041_26870 [Clostridium tetani]|uniref:SH3 domain-containing protein n=1 Tax=Clostridium tetani TaxID=1513 RepID=UPI002955B9E8|nr:SH3 domain-containing protein [Clostridium tetani]BDR73979.1 hypothetical protein K144316041_26870 [Clostridium tetani]
MFYYFNNKIAVQKRQIFVLKKQYIDFKNEKMSFAKEKIEIKYITPSISSTTIYTNCNLFISPLKSSPLLCTLEKGTYVTIIDSAEVNNEIWYEISIDSVEKINSKGWIQSKYIEINLSDD